MKTPIIVGNWKANKTIEEAQEWVEQIQNSEFPPKARLAEGGKIQNSVEVVLCAPFVDLPVLKEQLLNLTPRPYALNPKLGAQDISQFEGGAYTGEVTGSMLKGLAEYVIIGHSERRKYFAETEEVLKKKVERAKEAGLEVIYCVSSPEMPIPEGVKIVGYEPLFAIGSGTPDTPENAGGVAEKIKARLGVKVLYGGSVKPDNAQGFLGSPNLDGLLVGGASLNPLEFARMIGNAA